MTKDIKFSCNFRVFFLFKKRSKSMTKRSKNMTKDIKFSCNFHVFFLFKNHADTSLIEFKKPHFVEKRKNL